jgi:hypothetical protein
MLRDVTLLFVFVIVTRFGMLARLFPHGCFTGVFHIWGDFSVWGAILGQFMNCPYFGFAHFAEIVQTYITLLYVY